jgi:hypothetical protein
MFYPNTKVSKPQTEQTLAIDKFKGINISVNNTQIEDNETPEMLNMLSDDKGALDSRKGWLTLFDAIPDNTKIQSIFEYKKATGTQYLFVSSTVAAANLFKIDDIESEPLTNTLIASIDSQTRPKSFNFTDDLYVLEAARYMVYNGTTYSLVVGYIPTITIGTPPAGGGTAFESKNLIAAGFIQQYSGDGVSTDYQLQFTDLDATAVTVDISGVALTEGTEFEVNRTTGVVDFADGSAPHGAPELDINNVEITAFKTVSGDADKINKCTQFALWGATEGNRVFLAGNSDIPNTDFRSGLLDPTYFPNDGFDQVGKDTDAILEYSFAYDALVIIKQKSIYIRQYYESDGEPVFTRSLLNGTIGGVGSENVAILDNFPTFVTTKGVYQIVSIDPFNEENVRIISEKINRNIDTNPIAIDGILELGNLSDYVGIDFDKKYWLLHPTNDIAWVYDYDSTSATYNQWYRLDNISANTALEIGGMLYFGRDDKASIARFKDVTDSNIADDTDEDTTDVINVRWVSKIFDFKSSTNRKLVSKIFFTIKPAARTSASLYVRSDLRSVWRLVKLIAKSLFKYSLIKYSTFTYGANDFPQQSRTKVKEKKIGYYQIKLENLNETESLGILNVAIKFIYQREVKR